MNPNHIIVWTVCLSSIALLIRSIRVSKGRDRGWIIICLGILTLTIATHLSGLAWSGAIGGGLWLLLIVLPLVGMRRLTQHLVQYRFEDAKKWAIALSWLHPADGWPDQVPILQALILAQQGQHHDALELIEQHRIQRPSLGYVAKAILYSLSAQWETLYHWLSEMPPSTLCQTPWLMVYYLRSLGELDDPRLIREFDRLHPYLEQNGTPQQLNFLRMTVLAFAGQPNAVQAIFQQTLPHYDAHQQAFWMATAHFAAGNHAIARQQLSAIPIQHPLTPAINWRLDHLPKTNYRAIAADQIQRILTDLQHEHYYALRLNASHRRSYGTGLLIVLNLVAFSLELIAGGSQDLNVLYRLGALVPQDVIAGEWWRLLSAIFLHYGWLHLTMNMTGLAVMGALVEARLRVYRYLIAYFICGVGSMLCVTLLALANPTPLPQIAVGASGGIMGLIGLMSAILLHGWRYEKSRIAGQRLRLVSMVIGLQVVFDLSTPGISFVGHLSGMVIGFVVGLWMVRSPQISEPQTTKHPPT
jgi:rhomboid protease GluP